MAWHKKPRVPKGLQDWPADAINIAIDRIIGLYDAGFAGTKYDPEDRAALFDNQLFPDGAAR